MAQVNNAYMPKHLNSGAGTRGDGWYSFDIAGVHVIALVNTLNLKKLGHLGVDQLDFVAKRCGGAAQRHADHRVQPHPAVRHVYGLGWRWGQGRRSCGSGASARRRATCRAGTRPAPPTPWCPQCQRPRFPATRRLHLLMARIGSRSPAR